MSQKSKKQLSLIEKIENISKTEVELAFEDLKEEMKPHFKFAEIDSSEAIEPAIGELVTLDGLGARLGMATIVRYRNFRPPKTEVVVPEVYIVVYKRDEQIDSYLTLDEVDAREEFEFRQTHSQATMLYNNKDGGELEEIKRSTE